MISVSEAYNLVLKHTPIRKEYTHLTSSPFFLSSQEPLIADRDFPPYHRVAMDGIAINSHSFKEEVRTFKIQGCQKAGEAELSLDKLDNCIEVMTGAILPKNTDAVIKYEDIQINDGFCNILNSVKEIHPNQNVHIQGSDSLKGEKIINAGSMLNPAKWAIAASVGKINIRTKKKPRIDILSTGDELISIDKHPLPHQIRRSNPIAIQAALLQSGFDDVHLSHVADNKKMLLDTLASLLEKTECLIITGGVSAGRFDYVPSILTDLKVQNIFHKVRQKPGKPLWFGINHKKQPIFGLPGNPVSAIVCFYRYILPSLNLSIGNTSSAQRYARLEEDISFIPQKTLFAPVVCRYAEDSITYAKAIKTNGSGDFVSLGACDGFIELPSDASKHLTGNSYPLYTWRC